MLNPEISSVAGLTDVALVALLEDARIQADACSGTELTRIIAAIVVLELEVGRRQIPLESIAEASPLPVLRARFFASVAEGDMQVLAGRVARIPTDHLIPLFHELDVWRIAADKRFYGQVALCIALDTRLFDWETARAQVAYYTSSEKSSATQHRLLNRRWGFLLGVAVAGASEERS